MGNLSSETFEPDAPLLHRGEIGDRMCLPAGSVEVDTGSQTVTLASAGTLIGEIALLRDTLRAADVSAGPDGATVYWMDADAFLNAVNRVPRSRARVEAEVDRRLEP
jgi:CRP-like cAMP-binding protein